MTSNGRQELRVDEIARVLRTHLLTVMDEDDFDLVIGGSDGSLDLSTDDWSIHLEHERGFLAIDDEPADAASFARSRRAVMSEAVEHALAAADVELGGALSAALTATGDPFTLDFVSALSA
jgi:hypothetical protein